MKLTPCDTPLKKAGPKYLDWQPMIQEFLDSGSDCSRIDDIELENRHISQIRMCISIKYPRMLRLRVLKGVPYLTRCKGAENA